MLMCMCVQSSHYHVGEVIYLYYTHFLPTQPSSLSSQGAHSDGNLTKCVPTCGSVLQDLFYIILYCEDLLCLAISHFTM